MMLRERFESELRTLQSDILELGSVVEENLTRTVDALVRRDLKVSQELIATDGWVNERRIAIGSAALRLIATQQPAAGDMRLIASSIEIAGELERIHDYVKGIGRINQMIGEKVVPPLLLRRLPDMARQARQMLHQALAAYAGRDAAMAAQVPAYDDMVDDWFNETYRTIIDHVVKDPTTIDLANRVEWAAHNMERAADRVINICEWTIYMVTGRYIEVESEYEAPPLL
ncbi:MAG: phosphate signaling complex protein PhoU [Ardenticatenaceae bacterium]|nr:phosphate signaling complex protein PhoU [Ardenticatenaceae bacterium]